jgi:hypothetical protein
MNLHAQLKGKKPNHEIIRTFPEPEPEDDDASIHEHKKVLRAKIVIDSATTVRFDEHPTSVSVYNSTISVEREGKAIAAFNIGEMIKHQQLRLVHAALLRSGDTGMLVCEYEGGDVGAREGFAILRFSPAGFKLHTLPVTDYGKVVVFRSEPEQAEIWSTLDDNVGAAAADRPYITRACRWQSEGYVCGSPKQKSGFFSPGFISDPGIEIRP